ncbi:MAG: MMPL family transporter, partial [Desulfobacterales bacterium]|nr:MMPL family transporter [Desulfobacterales bacterium]
NDFITEAMDRTRISVLVGNISAGEFASLVQNVKGQCRTLFPPPLSYRVTGSVELYSQINQLLFKGLIKSLLAAFLCIGALMFLFLRSWRLGLLSFFPNAFPLAIAFGAMSILGLRMDIQAAMVGCISLGISVDGTIHLLHNYQLHPDKDARERIRDTWLTVGQPVLITTFSLVLVFTLLILSSVRPTRTYGLLSALAILSAMAGDLIYLPALLKGFFRCKRG